MSRLLKIPQTIITSMSLSRPPIIMNNQKKLSLSASTTMIIAAVLLLVPLMTTTTTTTNAFAAISGDTDLITIEEERSSCNPGGPFFTFALYYSFVGIPIPNSGWFRTELVSSDGVETLINRDWSRGVLEQGLGGGGIETSLDVGSEPYTLTVYEAIGPDPEGSGPFNDETITAKEGGWTASVTFTCADLDPENNPPPEPTTPLTERFKNQGQCVAYANANPEDEDVTKQLCKEAF